LLVFTTHTPIAAGHDRFDIGLVHEVLGRDVIPATVVPRVVENGQLNMTRLGLELSGHINGVAKKHGDVTREMFPGYRIDAITNGVHARSWVAPAIQAVFSKYLRGWELDPFSLRYALSLPPEDIWSAHQEAKRAMLAMVNAKTGSDLREDVFTIGFARRATAYKRAELLFSDVGRLRRIAEMSGKGIQIILAGKAHPHDHDGKLAIQHIIRKIGDLGPRIRAVYLENYNIETAKLLVSGSDLWLNTPIRPQEASGTSGMKAALNGVPQLSVLDGWWLEGHIEGVTGWSVGPHPEHATHVSDTEDAESVYAKLEHLIIPRYYDERDAWIRMMRQTIAINGSFFNTHRMVEQYVLSTYFL
jgi:starch phosphorylase